MAAQSLDLGNWILIPPNGNLAIHRCPVPHIPAGTRLANGHELLAANRGQPFPWGHLPEPHTNNLQWRERRIGVGGLFHKQWFVTSEGRFGGAANVTNTLPGSLRCCMYIGGGGLPNDSLADNEGFAVVKNTSEADQELYRKLQLYACQFVAADGGAIISSPIQPDGKVYVGFVGRCQICPNLELISFPQLKNALKDYYFELWPEWKGWSLSSAKAAANS